MVGVLTLAYGNMLTLEKLSLEKDNYHWLVSIVESGCEPGLTTAFFFFFFLLPEVGRDHSLPNCKVIIKTL